MKKIIFVTSNQGKYLSAKNFLRKYNINVVQKNLEIPESRESIEEIAIQKSKYAYKILKKPLIAIDAGFFINSLNGFPRMFVNFVLETIGTEGIIKLIEGKNKTCEFKEILCYCDNIQTKPKLFERIVRGTISKKPRGKVKPYHWSKLALIFIPEGKRKTLAEMTKKELMNFRKRVDINSHWEQFAKFFLKLKKN